MYTKQFWGDVAERSLSTFAQTFIAMVGVLAPMADMELLEINYIPVLTVSLVAAGLSVLKAIAAVQRTGTASLKKDNE
jgi:hypothetical protein